MNKQEMLKALKLLDQKIKQKAHLLLGGGGAMVLAYDFGLSTHDLDALFYKSEINEADVQKEIHDVALKMSLPKDWLNPHFQTFLFTLPKDYGERLYPVFEGKNLTVKALSLEDLLILKCFAGREKDIPHAQSLIRKIRDVDFVRGHILKLKERKIPGSQNALDFLDDLVDFIDL